MTQYMDGPQGLFKTYQKDVFIVTSAGFISSFVFCFSSVLVTKLPKSAVVFRQAVFFVFRQNEKNKLERWNEPSISHLKKKHHCKTDRYLVFHDWQSKQYFLSFRNFYASTIKNTKAWKLKFKKWSFLPLPLKYDYSCKKTICYQYPLLTPKCL